MLTTWHFLRDATDVFHQTELGLPHGSAPSGLAAAPHDATHLLGWTGIPAPVTMQFHVTIMPLMAHTV